MHLGKVHYHSCATRAYRDEKITPPKALAKINRSSRNRHSGIIKIRFVGQTSISCYLVSNGRKKFCTA
jgi:hypothetical protein